MKLTFYSTIMSLATLGIGNAADTSSAARDFPPNPIERHGWCLVAHDEFDGKDGGKLNPALWIDGYFPGRFGDDYKSPKMQSNYEFRSEGDTRFIVLKTLAERPKAWVAGIATFNTANWHKRYENEKIATIERFSSKYGYFEVRSRHPVAITGKDAAWWILDTHAGGEEIDVYEDSAYGGPNFHLKGIGPVINSKGEDYPVTKEKGDIAWRVYGMEIHETGIRFFLNNQLIHERQADWSNIGAWAHIFSLYVRNSMTNNEYHIDYFRAYRKLNDSNK